MGLSTLSLRNFSNNRLSEAHRNRRPARPIPPFELFNDAIDSICDLGWQEDIAHAGEVEIEHRDITAELELDRREFGECERVARQVLEVLGQPAASTQPRERPFNHPASRQKLKTPG